MSIRLSDDGIGVRRHAYPPNAEINVTPFVDVMLVLLVIFMVAAPLATAIVPVDLPKDTAAATPPPSEPVSISILPGGIVFVGTARTDMAGLVAAVDAAAHADHDTRILVRGDRRLDYGSLIAVMNRLADGGYVKVGLVTEQTEPAQSPGSPELR